MLSARLLSSSSHSLYASNANQCLTFHSALSSFFDCFCIQFGANVCICCAGGELTDALPAGSIIIIVLAIYGLFIYVLFSSLNDTANFCHIPNQGTDFNADHDFVSVMSCFTFHIVYARLFESFIFNALSSLDVIEAISITAFLICSIKTF